MKKLIVALAAITISSTAMADISILWGSSAGFYNYNVAGSPVDPTDYINNGGGSATAYLLWSPDSTFGVDLNNLGGNLLTGNDIVLDTFTANNAPYGDFGAGSHVYADATYGQVLDSGFVLIRTIDMTAPGGAAAQYFDGPASPLDAALYNPAAPVTQNLDQSVNTSLGDKMIAVPVPEPGVLAFLGIGSLMMLVRKFKRS